MILFEHEAKSLLQDVGIPVPTSFLLSEDSYERSLDFPLMLKAQTLYGKRGNAGLIKASSSDEEYKAGLRDLWLRTKEEGKEFASILIEEQLSIASEHYISFSFDTSKRSIVMVYSKFGGMDIEVVAKRQPDAVQTITLDATKELTNDELQVESDLFTLISSLYTAFRSLDAELLEVNPLIKTMDGAYMVADAKIEIDATAFFRHEFPFEQRTGGRALTSREKKARAIDARSHRGVVGRTYLDFDGDIAFLSSGGGASMTCMDALISYGGEPANYAEYSGNPEKEDVKELTRLLLGKKKLKGFWIVGPTANFTDVYETISGILEVLEELMPTYPIVIRRAGPRDDEAKEFVEEVKKRTGLDISFYGEEIPMTESAKILMDKVKAYG